MPSIPKFKRQPLAIFVDACIIVNAYTLAALVLFARWAPLEYYDELLIFLPIAVLVHCTVNFKFGLYRIVGRYAGIYQAIKTAKAVIVSVVILLGAGILIMRSSAIHVAVMVPIGGSIAFILLSGVRFYPRIFYERSLRELTAQARILIVGAGSAGEMILHNIQKEPHIALEAVALVDDNPDLRGLEIHGVPIYGPIEKIPEIVEKKDIDEILIAIPSATLEDFQRILQICLQTGKAIKTLRPLQSIHYGRVGLDNIQEIRIEDVLGRQPVKTDYAQISGFFDNKVVLVTGAGGSIGSELVMQISHHNPARVILVDQDESALYEIHERLSRFYLHNHEFCVTDIRSEARMEYLFRKHRPDIVFHAAAYKHVPLMELQPDEAVLNNVLGTWNVARIAGDNNIECFVNISTDKAVEPINILGATKLLGERVVSDLAPVYPETKYCSVRFGNVLGSRGSVIPIFRRQILAGGPVTITHPEMTRYFMLISEAVDLVLQAAAFAEEKAIYVLEMGKPIRIVDLAEQMINIMRPSEKIDITFTGLRPGEKLHEQLTCNHEVRSDTSHPMIYRVSASEPQPPVLSSLPDLIRKAENHDQTGIREDFVKWITTYTPFDMSLVGSISLKDGAIADNADPNRKIPADGLLYHWHNGAYNSDQPS